MQKNIAISLLILVFFGLNPLFADRILTEAKIGHFCPFSDTLRELYDDKWDDYQFEISYSPYDSYSQSRFKHFFAWGSYNFLFNQGFTFSGFEDTEVKIMLHAYSAGLKFILPLPLRFDVYGGIGARYVFLRADNQEDSEGDSNEKAEGIGGVFSMGFLFHPYRNLVIDFFGNLMVKHFGESRFDTGANEIAKSVDVGGLTFGFGIGFKF